MTIGQAGSTRDYWVFGLHIRSCFELPELVPAIGDSDPDVIIEEGGVAAPTGGKDGLFAVDNSLVLVVPDVARYRIDEGRRITVEAAENVAERNVRLFLLGSAFGALLHQRRMLPLHANAVEVGEAAVAFMGASGQGKSTLAAWFHAQGDNVIADDVCVIGFGGAGRPFASPGLPRLRLWAEALQVMGHDKANYQRSYIDEAAVVEKFDVPIKGAGSASRDIDLAALYLLDRGDALSITRLSGLEAAEAVFANTYRGSYLSAVDGKHDHWRSSIDLVRRVPVFRAIRPWDLENLHDQCRQLRDHAVEIVSRVREQA